MLPSFYSQTWRALAVALTLGVDATPAGALLDGGAALMVLYSTGWCTLCAVPVSGYRGGEPRLAEQIAVPTQLRRSQKTLRMT